MTKIYKIFKYKIQGGRHLDKFFKDGDFIKVTEIDGNTLYGVLMDEGENNYKVAVLKSDLDMLDISNNLKYITIKLIEDKFIDCNGYKINVDKIKDVLLVEEIRQLYNMYCGVR